MDYNIAFEYNNLNSYQSPINDELKSSLHKEVWDQLIDFIENTQYIK